jgi:hypothetical protein
MIHLLVFLGTIYWLKKWIPGAENVLAFATKWIVCLFVWESTKQTILEVQNRIFIFNATKN